MIKIQKAYLILFVIGIAYFIVLISLNYISDYHFKLSQKEIEELHIIAENNNLTAIRKLTNFYYFIEKDHNAAVNVYRKHKDINPKIKKALRIFLEKYCSDRQKDKYNDFLKEIK
ncbi:MAG: hypothetical protein LBL65_08700 [Campylobacteraceae bacterium]|jgi:hypothetical protein|nr:hypothetical protein [Campylobacteraceae bacterium]